MTQVTTPEKAHAKLSPSGAHRWMNCPGSVRLEKPFPDVSSEYAEEGTRAHELCELYLRHKVMKTIDKRTFNAALKKIKAKSQYNDEMLDHAQAYADHVMTLRMSLGDPTIYAEQKLDMREWIPDCFGTCDCVIAGKGELIIVDFKYGKGVRVEVKNNPQLRIYALGALSAFDMIYSFEHVCMVIIQPRLEGGYTSETISVDELLAFGEEVKKVAPIAYEEKGEVHAGEWCRFCKARTECKHYADHCIEMAGLTDQNPEYLTDEEIGEYLKKGELVNRWLSDLKEHAQKRALEGRTVKGWKLVAGRSIRQWTSEDEAFKFIIENGITQEAMLYERKSLTLSQVEKLIGKKIFEDRLSKFVTKPAGKPALVEDSDPRPVWSPQVDVDEAFPDSLPTISENTENTKGQTNP